MATETVSSATLSSAPLPSSDFQTAVDGTSSETDAPQETQAQSGSRIHRESTISDSDPNAFKITILLASSGYRTHLIINRSFLEKASLIEGDAFSVNQLKIALWKDWPSGIIQSRWG